jgi:protein phosphatase
MTQGQGTREYQQDRYAVWADRDSDQFYLVVADGMGGALNGEAIAEAAVDAMSAALSALIDQPPAGGSAVTGPALGKPALDGLAESIEEMSGEVWTAHRGQGGSTLIACLVRAGQLWFASVGDSSLFLRRDGRLLELNRRHEHRFDLWRQVLNGATSLEQAESDPQADALASYIGCEELQIDWTRWPLALEPGDVLLACSDGVSDTLPPGDLGPLLGLSPDLAADAIARRVQAASRAHQDNYTAVVARYGPTAGREAPVTFESTKPDVNWRTTE